MDNFKIFLNKYFIYKYETKKNISIKIFTIFEERYFTFSSDMKWDDCMKSIARKVCSLCHAREFSSPKSVAHL